ncbi:hypothetical protein AAHB33_09345 [Paenarthrobacter sp. S56]|uniref:hypothetical protein n=1 Tax=Paenarthrobacter sp. S56 TaxID=3138179 RepID=UPI00321C08B0
MSSSQDSRVNAEFIYRGSTIAPTNQVILPDATNKQEDGAAVGRYVEAVLSRPPAAATGDAHKLLNGMLTTTDNPNDQDVLGLIAYLQVPHLRDQLMADIAGIPAGWNTNRSATHRNSLDTP